ncbi:MAG TPA: uracil-DNA glycosylase family protein [Flavisolibacter sp.]|nr:uracil-DNA glycosylase family protein [Flavisolibacter sp.]
MQTTWAQHLISYYKSLRPPARLPNGIGWLYPQKDPQVMEVVERFLNKFFPDGDARKLLLGINPGRFGAGITGVNFTGPDELSKWCGISHPFKKRSELSAEFIYDMINAYGGPAPFYQHFFIGSVCPLGFVKEGKNLNYYDDKDLLALVEPFIIKSMKALLEGEVDRSVCYCIGGEKNYRYLSGLNQRFGWFKKIVGLPHPRFIMQYRRKQKEQFIQQYLQYIKDN